MFVAESATILVVGLAQPILIVDGVQDNGYVECLAEIGEHVRGYVRDVDKVIAHLCKCVIVGDLGLERIHQTVVLQFFTALVVLVVVQMSEDLVLGEDFFELAERVFQTILEESRRVMTTLVVLLLILRHEYETDVVHVRETDGCFAIADG